MEGFPAFFLNMPYRCTNLIKALNILEAHNIAKTLLNTIYVLLSNNLDPKEVICNFVEKYSKRIILI